MTQPDCQVLVPDADIEMCQMCCKGMVGSASFFRTIFMVALGRNVTQEEADFILQRINGHGPDQAQTWDAVPFSFWKDRR